MLIGNRLTEEGIFLDIANVRPPTLGKANRINTCYLPYIVNYSSQYKRESGISINFLPPPPLLICSLMYVSTSLILPIQLNGYTMK